MILRTVLAGPILRRAERGGVCIWLATSQPFWVKGEVFRFEQHSLSAPVKIGSGSAQSLQLGEQLFITLVTLTPRSGSFPADELLAYDLELCKDRSERFGMRLKDLGLLHGPQRLTYDEVPLPSFILREQQPLSFLYGSCRKLHSPGEDCLAAADEAIANTVFDPAKRPSALFLTGDQIYADDVSAALLPHLTELGMTLTGREESIPGIDTPWPDIAVGSRAQLVRERAQFTSDRADNHLLTFGEYAAMYLLAWNRDVWPSELPADTPAQASEVKHLEQTRDRLYAVRRALANVPTYMIFDDHELTDDWNLNDRWQNKVFSTQAGRRIIANGLAAYFAFQGWGNDPTRFDPSFLRTLQQHLAGGGDADRAAKQYDRLLWSYRGWSYTAPTVPVTLVLDTRTERGYDSEHGPCRLISRNGMSTLLALAKRQGFQKGQPLHLVSPTPVYGYEDAEWCLQNLVGKLTGPYLPDLEAWHAHPAGRVEFLTFLAEHFAPSRLLILSGDVHYAFTVQALFHDERFPPLPIVQLTSSAQKNNSAINDFVALSSHVAKHLHNSSRRFGWHRPPARNVAAVFPVLSTVAEKLENFSHSVFAANKEPGGLTLLSDDEYRSSGIEEKPNFEERRRYVQPGGRADTLMVGENNLGLVQLSDDARCIKHHLLLCKNGQTRRVTALIEYSEKW